MRTIIHEIKWIFKIDWILYDSIQFQSSKPATFSAIEVWRHRVSGETRHVLI